MKEMEHLQQLVQVAKMYYEENMTQQTISKKLGTTRQNISKMLNEARENNIVEIKINDVKNNYYTMADQIKKFFSVKNVIIVPGYFDDVSMARKTVAQEAESYIDKILYENDVKKIGISWGRSVYSLICQYQKGNQWIGKEVIPMIGASNRTAAYFMVNEMVRSLSEKTGAQAHFVNFPLEPLSTKDYELFVKTEAYNDILKQWLDIDMAIVGIGTLDNLDYRSCYPGENRILDRRPEELVGDLCTHYFSIDGTIVDVPDMVSMIHIPIRILNKIQRIVALVNGREKVNAVIGALRLGLITDIILDESVAKGVLEQLEKC